MDATAWTAVGSVGTAVAVVVALITLWVSRRQYVKQLEAERAAELREVIRTFEETSADLIHILLDGSAIVAASEGTVRSLRVGLGNSASTLELWALLAEESQVFSAAIIGWTGSPVTSDLRRARAAVAAASERLSGELNLLSSSGYLVDQIADDGYSPKIFTQLLSGELLETFKRDNGHLPFDRILWKLSEHLQGNASLYFAARYQEALQKLGEFIQLSARAISSLSARNLALAARSTSALQPTRTFTGAMRANLEGIQSLLSDDLRLSLHNLLAEIENLIAKDGALDRAKNIKGKGGAPAAADVATP